MPTAVLVTYEDDYADEFNVHGFKLFETKGAYDAWISEVEAGWEDLDHSDIEAYFGTNEYMEYDSFKDWAQQIEMHPISEDFHYKMSVLFGNGMYDNEWGIFINPLDHFEE